MNAQKTEKPNVARRIVKAIRTGKNPGRFLRKVRIHEEVLFVLISIVVAKLSSMFSHGFYSLFLGRRREMARSERQGGCLEGIPGLEREE